MIAEYELTGNTPTLPRIAAQLRKLSFTTDLLGSQKVSHTTSIKSYEDIIDRVSEHF
jgi:hypothetical protein